MPSLDSTAVAAYTPSYVVVVVVVVFVVVLLFYLVYLKTSACPCEG